MTINTRRIGAVLCAMSAIGSFDHTSILKLIEWRWHLQPLTARDASSDVGNLLQALNLNDYDAVVPNLPLPPSPTITPCAPFAVPAADRPRWEMLGSSGAVLQDDSGQR